MRMTAITGTIKKGKLKPNGDLTLFPDGTDVIVLARADWDNITGSDSTRHQLAQAKEALEAVKREPEKAKEILNALEAKK